MVRRASDYAPGLLTEPGALVCLGSYMDALPAGTRITGTRLTAADPEPPEGTVVVDVNGYLWIHTPPDVSPWATETVETWAEFAERHEPVVVVDGLMCP